MGVKGLVSVIIIFLNAEQFIREAIESVFAQTYPDWELLLIDDGSSDQSSEVGSGYASQSPERVRYLEHPGHQNCGMPASRNLGISYAKGEYIAFLDADDVWMPQKLEQQVAILNSHPEAGMVYGLSQYWYSWTGRPEDMERDFKHELGVPPDACIKPPTLISLFFLTQKAAIPSPSSILVRHEIVAKVNGFDDYFRNIDDIYEDQAFYAKVCLKSNVFTSSQCWDKYRQHPGSSSSLNQRKGQEYSTRLFFMNWLERYLTDQGVKDPQIFNALQKEQWRCRYPLLQRMVKVKQDLKDILYVIAMRTAQRILPLPTRRWLWAKWTGTDFNPPVGSVRFGSLRRLAPLSHEFGFDRGLPIDRYYIEQFITRYCEDIHGHVLEIEDDIYTQKFGGDRVDRSDVLHYRESNSKSTIVADLTCSDQLPGGRFDCVILTQTLQFIYDFRAALMTVHRILKPGGVVLLTVPGISQTSRYDMEQWGQYWSFTPQSLQRLFEEVFPATNVKVEAYGNVLSAISLLQGLASQELRQPELDHRDPDFNVLIAVRASK